MDIRKEENSEVCYIFPIRLPPEKINIPMSKNKLIWCIEMIMDLNNS